MRGRVGAYIYVCMCVWVCVFVCVWVYVCVWLVGRGEGLCMCGCRCLYAALADNP